MVVVQEIFGVNPHIRSVADGYARDGFLAVAPALFDRIEAGVELGYEGADHARAMSLMAKLDVDNALLDIGAAVDFAAVKAGRKWAWSATVWEEPWPGSPPPACRCRQPWATTADGSQLRQREASRAGDAALWQARCHIPAEEVEKVRAAHPEVEVYWYNAGHGFNCDARASFDPGGSEARERTLSFLRGIWSKGNACSGCGWAVFAGAGVGVDAT